MVAHVNEVFEEGVVRALYQRGFDPRATTAIPLEAVIGAVKASLERATTAAGDEPQPHAGVLS